MNTLSKLTRRLASLLRRVKCSVSPYSPTQLLWKPSTRWSLLPVVASGTRCCWWLRATYVEQIYQTRLLTGEPPCILAIRLTSILVHRQIISYAMLLLNSFSNAYIYASGLCPISTCRGTVETNKGSLYPFDENLYPAVFVMGSPTDPVFGVESARSSLTGKTAHGVQSSW